MKKFLEEFKAFALRGNVIDLAIGVLIGGAFTNVVTALTEDIINPILNLFGGAQAELGWAIKLGQGEGQSLLIGAFISAIINFIIMAFVIFMIMKSLNKLATIGQKKEEPKPAAPTEKECPYCKTMIKIGATRCPNCTSELN